MHVKGVRAAASVLCSVDEDFLAQFKKIVGCTTQNPISHRVGIKVGNQQDLTDVTLERHNRRRVIVQNKQIG